MQPIFERLLIVALQLFAAFFHLQKQSRPPEQIGEARAFALVDAIFQRAARFEDSGMAEGLHEAIAEDLRLAFFIAAHVAADEVNELGQLGGRSIHWRVRGNDDIGNESL